MEKSVIIPVDETNLSQAATIHSVSWRESHRAFCSVEFLESHTPEQQLAYLENKIKDGTNLYMLIDEEPMGIVAVTGDLIEDLYVLPDKQNMGYGTELLRYAIARCTGTPTLWVLENNTDAVRLYLRMGFSRTGRKNAITNELDEIEFALNS